MLCFPLNICIQMKLPISHALCLNLNYHCFLFGEVNLTGAIVNAKSSLD